MHKHQRKQKYNYNSYDTHNSGHAGLALISILCLHIGKLGYHPEVGIIGMGHGHGTGANGHDDEYLCQRGGESQGTLIIKLNKS